MEWLALLRMAGALLIVLALLGGGAWVVRRYDLRLPGRLGLAPATRRLEVIERLALDPRRALVLVRDGEREHLMLLGADHALKLSSRRSRTAAPNEELARL